MDNIVELFRQDQERIKSEDLVDFAVWYSETHQNMAAYLLSCMSIEDAFDKLSEWGIVVQDLVAKLVHVEGIPRARLSTFVPSYVILCLQSLASLEEVRAILYAMKRFPQKRGQIESLLRLGTPITEIANYLR